MSISMYQISVPVFVRALKNLSAILEKAVKNAEARKIDLNYLVSARLAPDMLPLSAQIQIAGDTAKGTAGRLAGVELPRYEDNEKTFPELQERIAKTVAFLESLKPEQFEGSEDRTVTIQMRGQDFSFKGSDYLLTRQLPNFFFHVTTAYAILRHNGADIGKRDYLG